MIHIDSKPRWFFTLIAALLCLFSSAAAETWFDFKDTLEFNRPIELNLETVRGDVIIVGGTDNRLIVDAVKRVWAKDWAKAERIAERIEIKVEQFGSEVRIQTEYQSLAPGDRSFLNRLFGKDQNAFGDVDYYITLPQASRVTVRAVTANIELSSIEARIEIENRLGAIRGEFLKGPVTVRQESGPIDLQWVEGDVRVKSESGRIWIKQVQGALDLTTNKGDVAVQTDLDSPRDFFVETRSGKVEFLVPQRSSGLLNIETRSGDIATAIPVSIQSASKTTLVGQFGIGGPRIEISSRTGDVMVAGF